MRVHPAIRCNIKKIRQYTQRNASLRRHAHHFLYDKRYSNSERIDYIVMGINPGEPTTEKNKRTKKMPLEETSLFDFIKEGVESRPAKRWRKNCQSICGTDKIALTEALFWSSLNVKRLQERYGRLDKSPHFKFCIEPNKDLIKIHRPRVVLFVGIGLRTQIANLYGLSVAGRFKYSRKKLKKGARYRRELIIAPHADSSGMPWVFVKHWSARVSRREKKAMMNFVIHIASRGRPAALTAPPPAPGAPRPRCRPDRRRRSASSRSSPSRRSRNI